MYVDNSMLPEMIMLHNTSICFSQNILGRHYFRSPCSTIRRGDINEINDLFKVFVGSFLCRFIRGNCIGTNTIDSY